MSNIAIGIGLSGKEKADLRGLEYLVGAEKDMAAQREAKKKAEDAAKQKLIDDVMKNTAFKQQFGNAFFQKEFERDAAARMAKIIEPMMSGQTDYTNIAVLANNEISALERANRQRKIEDESMSSVVSAFTKSPQNVRIADPKEIDGKTYNSPIQAANALAGDPDAAKKVAEAWGGANWYFGANEDPELGRMSFMFNPEMAMVTDPYEMGRKSVIGKGEFTKQGTSRSMALGRTTKTIQPFLPSDNSVNAAVLEAAATPPAQNFFMLQGYDEFLRDNPKGTFPEYVQKVGDPNAYLNGKFDDVKTYLSGLEGRVEEISDTKPAPKESSQSDSAKNAKKLVTDGAFNMTGDTFEMAISGSGQKSNVISIPKGAAFRAGTEKWSNTPQKADIEATPIRIEWNGPGKPSVIVYQSQFAPDGTSMQEVKQTYTYRIPLTKSSLAQAAGVAGTESDVLVGEIVSKYSGGPIDQFKKWYTASGGAGSPDEIQPAGTSNQNPASGAIGQTANKAAPQKMDAQGKSYEGSGTSLTKTQKDALSAFEAQLGRKPTETEKAKILEKYK